IHLALEEPFAEVAVETGTQANPGQNDIMASTDVIYQRSDDATINLLTVEMKDLLAQPTKFATRLMDLLFIDYNDLQSLDSHNADADERVKAIK
ncbi:unnamed protein product, partial [Didymodactylos carnosus]